MPLVPTADIIRGATGAGRGVAAFNVIQLEHAEALVAAAEAAGAPVVLQLSENCVRYHGALRPIALAAMAVAEASSAPVAVHLDHAESVDLVHEAVALGLPSVMFDAAKLDYDENVRRTQQVTAYCHQRGVWVEAELGEVGGKDGAHAPGARTDPDQARDFVRETGVDALAVAIGTSHAMLTRSAALDLDLLARLGDAVPVPLVLHGSSGVPDDLLRRAVATGITKVNIATILNQAFTSAVRAYLADHPDTADTRKYLAPGRDALAREAERLLHLVGTPDARRGHGHAGR